MAEADLRLFLLAGGLLFVIGLHGLLARRHPLRRIMALNIMGAGVFLLFAALAARVRGTVADPVPQAMVLTGIVVSVCATGLALALALAQRQQPCDAASAKPPPACEQSPPGQGEGAPAASDVAPAESVQGQQRSGTAS